MYILIFLFSFALLFFIAAGLYLSVILLHPKMRTEEQIEEFRIKGSWYDPTWYDLLPKREMQVLSPFGYQISATYIPNKKPSQDTIIICHGVTMRTASVIKYLAMFLKMGYNAMFVDHRAHGKSGGRNVTYGYFEKYDLAEALKLIKSMHSGKIGVIGESMGGAISMQALSVSEDIDFLISDCGFTSLEDEIKHHIGLIKWVPVYPTFWFAWTWLRIIGGFNLFRVSPINALRETSVPVMIIHGDQDTYVPYSMAKPLYNAINHKKKKLYVAKGAAHACAYESDPDKFKAEVNGFINAFCK